MPGTDLAWLFGNPPSVGGPSEHGVRILPGDQPWSPWNWSPNRQPVDVPPPKPGQGWFARTFTGIGEAIGGLFGGVVGAATRPLIPLLIMIAVIGVITFAVLGRLKA